MRVDGSRWWATLAVVAITALAVACGGSSDEAKQLTGGAATAQPATSATAEAQATPANPFAPVIAFAEQIVGSNRFALGLLDSKTNTPIPDAQMKLRFFTVENGQGTLRFEANATFRAPAREAGLASSVPHTHVDGTLHTHSNAEADVGVYTAQVSYDRAGQWGVQAIFATPDGRQGQVTAAFQVLESSKVPNVGQPAPRSRQPLLKDVKDIAEIDSAVTPDPALHTITIADAIASGKPSLVMFATPGYCSSRFCGPSYEIVRGLMPKYSGQVHFIHVEVYKEFVKLTPSDTFLEWNLRTEPWFFIVDGKGIISARFDGATTGAELGAALSQVAP